MGHAVDQGCDQAGEGGFEVDADVAGLPQRRGHRDDPDDQVARLVVVERAGCGNGVGEGSCGDDGDAFEGVDALESDLAFEAEGDMGQQVAEELALGERGRQDAGQFARGDFLAAGQSRGDVVSPVAVSRP